MQQTFARLLPGEIESQFLRACVDPSASGQESWQRWRVQHILQDELEHDGTGTKRLLPLLAYTLEQSGAALDVNDLHILRAARLREQLRAEKIRAISSQVLAVLQQGGVKVRLLKGAAISQTVYPDPDLRHTHDLDLLVRVPELTRAANLLRGVDFSLNPAAPRAHAPDLHLIHSNGLPLVLHTTLFQTADSSLPDNEIWGQRVPVEINGVETQILSPEMMLLHVLGQTFYTRSRRLRVWVCDAYFLATRSPAFDWEHVADLAARARVTLPLFLTLEYLRRALSLPVPQTTLDDLECAASKTSQSEYESALTLLRQNGLGGYRHWLDAAQNPKEKMQVARWVLRSYGKKQ